VDPLESHQDRSRYAICFKRVGVDSDLENAAILDARRCEAGRAGEAVAVVAASRWVLRPSSSTRTPAYVRSRGSLRPIVAHDVVSWMPFVPACGLHHLKRSMMFVPLAGKPTGPVRMAGHAIGGGDASSPWLRGGDVTGSRNMSCIATTGIQDGESMFWVGDQDTTRRGHRCSCGSARHWRRGVGEGLPDMV
jgi:hypothetical protein